MNVHKHKNVENVIRYFLLFLPPRGVKNIIDIGAGCTTPYKGILRTRCKKYTATDIRGSERINEVVDFSKKTKFKNKEFEWGWCSEVLEHIPPKQKEDFLKEVLRVCRNLVLTFPRPEHPIFHDDPGHTEVKIDIIAEYGKKYDITDKTTKNGRSIYIFREPGYIDPEHPEHPEPKKKKLERYF